MLLTHSRINHDFQVGIHGLHRKFKTGNFSKSRTGPGLKSFENLGLILIGLRILHMRISIQNLQNLG